MSKLYKGKEYWTIGWRLGSMEPKEVIFHDDDLDKVRSADGNMFETEDQALAALDRVKKALRGADAYKSPYTYIHGQKVEPGDIIVVEDGGVRRVLQYVHDDWFYGIDQLGNFGCRIGDIIREIEFKNMAVKAIYRPVDYRTIAYVISGMPVPQQNIVWEEDKVREMSIADIEKELGYRIKVVKES